MAKFDIQFADKPVNVQSTAAYARPDTATSEAISRVGQSIFQIGEQRQKQKDALEYSQGQRRIEEMTNAATDSLTGDENEDTQVLEKLKQDINSVQYGNRHVDTALQIHRNKTMPGIEKSLSERHKALYDRNVTDGFDAEGQTRLAKGDLIGYQDLLDRRFASKNISQARYEALSKSAMIDSTLEHSRDLISSGNPENITSAKRLLSAVPDMESATTEKKEYAQKLLSIANRQSDQLSDESNKQLTDLMIAGTISTDEVMKRRNSLKDNDYQAWAKIAMAPIDKRGNIIQTTEFKTLAMDVWRGTLSRTDAEVKIRDSLADPNGINDKQYAAIYEDLNREVKTYQAQDMKSYSIEATRLILGKDAGVITFDALGNVSIDVNKRLSPQADFEKKMNFVNIYNKQMSDYLAEFPKASKKELYVKSQELKSTYLAASKGQSPVTENIINISDDDKEWEALETGQRYRGPDGLVRIK